MDRKKILKKVIGKLEEMKENLKNELDVEFKKLEETRKQEEKIAAFSDQEMLNDFILKLKMLESPEEVKKLVAQFDFINNAEKKQAPRLKLLNEIKKENLFRFKEIKGMREMWRKLVTQEWEIHYLFGEL